MIRACSSGGPDRPPLSHYPEDISLTELWRNDINYLGARSAEDSKKAVDSAAVWRELLAAAFGRGERPALRAELQRLQAELEATNQQAKLSELRLAHSTARVSELQRRARLAAPAAAAAVQADAPPDAATAEHWCVGCGRAARTAQLLTLRCSVRPQAACAVQRAAGPRAAGAVVPGPAVGAVP